MTDLISRSALLEAFKQSGLYIDAEIEELVETSPAIKPQVVANISGGVLQGASADYPVDVYALDFETDTFDEANMGIIVEDAEAYLYQTSSAIDPAFVRDVVEAEVVFIHNRKPVCTECDGAKLIYDFEAKTCTACNGTGEKPDA